MSCGCTQNGLTNCGCSDNCPYKTSDITVFDGNFTSIVLPAGAGLNEALEALEEFTINSINNLSLVFTVNPGNCIGLAPGQYGYNQVLDAVIAAICDLQTSVSNIETDITNIQTDITTIQTDITTIESDITTIENNIGDSMPLGSMIMFPVAAAPNSKWLTCEGQSIAVASYPALFALIGYNFGGSGTHFNLPDLQQKFIAGYDGGGPSDYQTIGQGAGANSVTLTSAQSGLVAHSHTAAFSGTALPAHSHGIWADPNDGADSGAIDLTNDDGSAYYDGANAGGYNGSGLYIEPKSAGTPSGSVTVNAVAGSNASESHENRPEFVVFPWMIKVLN